MKRVLVIGSGISGMACAVRCARHGVHVMLVSPDPSERSQSIMAAGGINAVIADCDAGDSVACHIEDTLKGGCYLGGRRAVTGLCENGEEILKMLVGLGTVFSVDKQGQPLRRAFGGQTYKRTYYCGASTGKQIVSALVMEARRFEAEGLIERRLRCCFHSALIHDGVCYGALLYDETANKPEAVLADAVVMATGGQNALFGKTTGSTQCDGYAEGRLFMQGAALKNLEFIQFHPTTIETPQKRMLISEAARGEGGRLFYERDGKRIYFMEEKYGAKGNLMTRDVISREMGAVKEQVYLDISFLGKKLIDERLPEVRDICAKYGSIDVYTQPIPVSPSVHFFMGGFAVHSHHETNIRSLFAVGECASMYHGANRLGGNSLLAAMYSGGVAAEEIAGRPEVGRAPDFGKFISQEYDKMQERQSADSPFPVMYIRDMLAESMRSHMGIVRDEKSLDEGISDVEHLLSVAEHLRYDSSVRHYTNYSLTGILTLARATLQCARSRKESRGAHYRSDAPKTSDEYGFSTIITYDGGSYNVRLDKEHEYES
ncbi:L-aspartate oxidase [uncultured Ruminococcus sp.]|uniref:L-aspartate oxidase n=1 Tax=uncultured Ruminococcus sp. TaxID=165186 RepID=UPI0025F08332|nr:FAD-binding protein [uncultured Ruminococcus sp.]